MKLKTQSYISHCTAKQSLRELISLCKKYLQNDPEDTQCLADKNSYDYFKQLALQKRAQNQTNPRPPQGTTEPNPPVANRAQASVSSPVIAIEAPQKTAPIAQVAHIPPPKDVLKKQESVKPKPATASPPPASSNPAQTLSLPLMPRPFAPSQLPPFGDMKEKVTKFAPHLALNSSPVSDEAARTKTMAWKDNYPQFAILSFFPAESEEHAFLKNVSGAINTRLRSCKLYEASSTLARELIVLAETEHLKAVVLAADTHTLSKANEFLLLLHLQEAPEIDFLPLSAKGMLYDTLIFELVVTKEIQVKPDEKLALWKMLTRLSTAS